MSHSVTCPGFVLIPYGVKSVGSWACTASFYSFMGLDIVLAKAPARLAHWASISVVHFLAMPMDLLNVIPAMLAHWIYYLFPRALTIHLLYFYLLLCP